MIYFEPMNFTFRLLDENSARMILNWQYEPPSDLYNLASSNPEDTLRYLLDPQNAFFGIYGPAGHLEGYCSFGPDGQVPGGDYSTPALDICLGVRPDLTGRGRGSDYVRAVIDFAYRTYRTNHLRVTIAAFNARARRVWEKAGFQVIQTFQSEWTHIHFVIMIKAMK